MVIPKFSLGAEGVKRSSVKLPQCEKCDGLACYTCWKNHLQKDDAVCPGCKEPIEKRKEINEHGSQVSRLQTFIEGEEAGPDSIMTMEQNEVEDFDRTTVFCHQKLLLKILAEQKIRHECELYRKESLAKAEEMWAGCFKELEDELKSEGSEDDALEGLDGEDDHGEDDGGEDGYNDYSQASSYKKRVSFAEGGMSEGPAEEQDQAQDQDQDPSVALSQLSDG